MTTMVPTASVGIGETVAAEIGPSDATRMTPVQRHLVGAGNAPAGVAALIVLAWRYGVAEELVTARERAGSGAVALRTLTVAGVEVRGTLAVSLLLVTAAAVVGLSTDTAIRRLQSFPDAGAPSTPGHSKPRRVPPGGRGMAKQSDGGRGRVPRLLWTSLSLAAVLTMGACGTDTAGTGSSRAAAPEAAAAERSTPADTGLESPPAPEQYETPEPEQELSGRESGGGGARPGGGTQKPGEAGTRPGGGTQKPGGGTPEGPPVVVAGPTLENRYPEVWNVFRAAAAKCSTYVVNPAVPDAPQVDVLVVDTRIVDESPPGSFTVYDASAPPPGGKPCSLGTISEEGDPVEVPSTCRGARITADGSTGCRLAVVFSGHVAVDHGARLRITHRATCTDRVLRPCDRLPAENVPTSANPVTVEWTTTRDTALVACLASDFTDVGGYTGEELAGRCPSPPLRSESVGESPSPTPSGSAPS